MIVPFLIKICRFLLILLIVAIASFLVFFAILQSKWAKTEIQKSITLLLSQGGIVAELSSVEGQLPISWKIDHADLHFPKGETLALDQISFRIAIFPLFRGKCEIDYIHVDRGTYTFKKGVSSPPLSWEEARQKTLSFLETFSLPFSVNLGHVGIDRITLQEEESQERFDLAFTGNIKLLPKKRVFSLSCTLFSPDTKTTYLETSLFASSPQNLIKARFFAHLPSLPSSFFLQGEVQADLSLQGPWTSWEKVLGGKIDKTEGIQGLCRGQIFHASCPSVPLIQGTCEGQGKFSVLSFHTLHLIKSEIKTPVSQLDIHGILHSDWNKNSLALQASCFDLSPFSLHIKGDLLVKGIYKKGDFHLFATSKNLAIDSNAINRVNLSLSGKLSSDLFEAAIDLKAQEGVFPLQGNGFLSYKDQIVSLNDLSFSSENDHLKGSISYCMDTKLFTGTLHANIEEIHRFEPFFADELPYGAISIDLDLNTEEEKQKGILSCSSQFIRYSDLLIDDLFVKTHLEDPLGSPQGGIYLLAHNVFTPRAYFDSVLLESESDPDHLWSFFTQVKGRTNLPFHLQLSGSWKKENQVADVLLSQAVGEFANLPLLLDHPVQFSKTPSYCTLNPLDLTLGEGHLHLEFTSSKQGCKGSLETSSFPLQILHVLTPGLQMQGSLTASGFLEGDEKEVHGALQAALEESQLTKEGKETPLLSKGSLQIHLENKMLQAHLDLRASQEQFLDSMASLPIQYNLHPFSLTLDPEKPLSAEMTAEGLCEELFDFVNLGTNHFRGLLSCRLFLSNTLLQPSLAGKIAWQEGCYENDFTGIRLSKINAHFEASEDKIQLTSLEGKDDLTGTVSAYGSLDLKPDLLFPYHFTAEMQNLHAVDFDMIDCSLSGPLYLYGTQNEMFAEGNLVIDRAMIHIAERFPQEVPFLPFSYIHKPSQLASTVLKKGGDFLFHMDLDVTADQTIKAEGVGLLADLTGHIRLQGTNTSILASGSLDLVKGEYLFAGKVFKLTEGHLAFNDKTAPFAHLNVSGNLALSDVIITVNLRGPITAPQLSFQSNPQKPTSSILALILFNKDISEINQMEALQLASTLISISGGAGPNILDSIRKTIGVDRLNISSRAGSDEMTVQIGKYLTKGVMITLSQSATSSQVIVEVELPKGFVFQAETQEEQEGKFSLKWRKNY